MPDKDGGVALRTTRGAGWLVGWQMATRCLGLASTLILARLLVPADFGIVAMAATFTAAINSFSNLGVSDALVRRPDTTETWFDTAFTLQALRGLITGGVIALGSSPVATWFDEPRLAGVLLILAAVATMTGFENIGIVEYRRTLRFDMEFRLLLLPRLLQFTVTIALAWLWGDYRALIAGTVVGTALRLGLTYVIHPYRPHPSLTYWRELMGFSAWIWAGSIASLVWDRCDAFILGPVVGSARLGTYLFSLEIATMPVSELVGPAMRALYSGLSLARHRGSEVAGLTLGIVATLLAIVVPVSIGISATSGHIVVGLLGPKWEAARPMIATFAWLCCVSPVAWVCSSILTAQGQVRRNFVAIASSAAVKCLAMVLVVWNGHADLAPAVAVGSVVIEAAVFLMLLGRLDNLRWRDNAGGFARVAIGGAVAVGLLLFTGLGWQHVAAPPLMALAEGIAIGLGTMGVCMGVQAMCWLAVGRPLGPEHRLLGMGIAAIQRK